MQSLLSGVLMIQRMVECEGIEGFDVLEVHAGPGFQLLVGTSIGAGCSGSISGTGPCLLATAGQAAVLLHFSSLCLNGITGWMLY